MDNSPPLTRRRAGAAGGAILNAELLVSQGYVKDASAVLAESAMPAR